MRTEYINGEVVSYLRRGVGVAVAVRRAPSAKKLRNWRYCACASKRKYTIEEAEARIANALKPLTFYKCRFCDAHHLTSRVTQSDAEVKP